MTPQQVVGVGIRLFAIWLALQTLQYLTSMPSAMMNAGIESAAPAYMIAIGYFAAALALWFFPMVAAHQIVPRTRYEDHMHPQTLDVARVGCAILGIFLLSRTVPVLVSYVFRAFLIAGSGSAFATLSNEAKLDLAYYIAELVLALFLVFQSERAGRFILRAGASQRDVIDSSE